MQQAKGTAHGKIILMGEHSVVYNQPAIALPFFSVEVTTTIKPSRELTLECDFYQGTVAQMPELLKSLQTTIQTCLERIHPDCSNITIQIRSSIPIERGMGSSAAVAVATTRAIYQFFQHPLSQSELLDIVDIAEHIAHGNPSGLDALMTSSDIAYRFVKNEGISPLESHIDAYLVIADTGQTGQTKEAVQAVKQLIQQPLYQHKIKELGQYAEMARQCLYHNQTEQLGDLMTKAHSCLKELTVSSPKLDTFVKVAIENGALGAKLTGGGRGGCMIALAKTPQSAKHIEQALIESGACQTWIFDMKGL